MFLILASGYYKNYFVKLLDVKFLSSKTKSIEFDMEAFLC